MEFIEQFLDILNIDQVDKSVSDIAVILKIDGQVEKVVLSGEASRLNFLKDHFLGILVRNVPKHESGSPIVLRLSRPDTVYRLLGIEFVSRSADLHDLLIIVLHCLETR